MSRTFFCLRRRRGFSPRHPAPVTIEDAGLVSGPGVGFALFHLSRFIFSSSDERRSVSETVKHSWLYGVNHGSICDSRPSAFSGYPRGHRVNTEAQCHRHCAPTGDKDAHPRTRASQEPTPLRDRRLLGHSCEYCYLWIHRSDRGNLAAAPTSRLLTSLSGLHEQSL